MGKVMSERSSRRGFLQRIVFGGGALALLAVAESRLLAQHNPQGERTGQGEKHTKGEHHEGKGHGQGKGRGGGKGQGTGNGTGGGKHRRIQ